MSKSEVLHAFIISLKAFMVAVPNSPEEELFSSLACDWRCYACEMGWEDEVTTIEEIASQGWI